MDAIEIPDSPRNISPEPIIESVEDSTESQMEIEGLDLNLAVAQSQESQLDEAIPVSDSDDESTKSQGRLNNTNSSSNASQLGLKLEPIELETPISNETSLSIVPVLDKTPDKVPTPVRKKPARNRHTIIEPSKGGFHQCRSANYELSFGLDFMVIISTLDLLVYNASHCGNDEHSLCCIECNIITDTNFLKERI